LPNKSKALGSVPSSEKKEKKKEVCFVQFLSLGGLIFSEGKQKEGI